LLADRPITIAQALLILPPENINAASLANGHISLAWDKVGTETDYVIYRSDSETETYARLGTANTTSYTDATVTIGNTYYYRISSVKNNVESEKSAVVVSALAEIGSLASPEGLTVTGQTENSITLSWQAVSDATSYKVYKGSSSDAVNEYVAETASISYTVTGLAANTSYYFAVSAAHESGESLPSAAVQGKTSLASPQGLSVTGQTGNSISLSWQAVSGATSYKVYKGSSSDSISDYVAETALASYTVTDLESNTSYYFTVSAVYESEESLPSATVQGKTSLASPQGLSITGQTENSITLSWQAVSGATSYKVYKGSSSDTVNEYVVETSLASHTVTGLTAGTSYYFSVSAIHESGESLPSVAVQEKTSEMIAPVPVVIAGDLSLTVNWDSVPLADSYNVYCSTAPILPGTPYQTGVTGTSATITGLSNDTTYYVWVEAVKSGGTKTSEAVPGIPQLPTVQEHTVYSATGFTQAVAEINASSTRGFYHITLFSNITANNVSFSATSVEKTIVIKGDTSLHTISNTADTNLFSVWSGNTLVLENNVKLDGNARTGNVVQIYDEGTLVMKDGSRIENAKGYSAVSVYNGIFDMSGGEISGNAGSLCSVYVSGGVFTMSGGKVSGSTGSGVGIYGGTSTMSGGEISGNTSSGVSISTGTFMMSGGEICGNTSNGVSSSGTFTMSGGEISRNTASYSGGGGVYVSGGTFTMSGGTISDNIASSSFSSYGGGVSVISGTFTMSGGEISGNTSSYGGGVSVISYNSSYISTFTMSGGEISGNISSSGGGVYVSNYDSSYNATFTKNGGGTIYGSDASNDLKNTAESGDNYGHAVYVYGSPAKKRDITAGPSVNMNSNYTGAAGGWEE
jgi:fibronectin type 3 domain-containing protein